MISSFVGVLKLTLVMKLSEKKLPKSWTCLIFNTNKMFPYNFRKTSSVTRDWNKNAQTSCANRSFTAWAGSSCTAYPRSFISSAAAIAGSWSLTTGALTDSSAIIGWGFYVKRRGFEVHTGWNCYGPVSFGIINSHMVLLLLVNVSLAPTLNSG